MKSIECFIILVVAVDNRKTAGLNVSGTDLDTASECTLPGWTRSRSHRNKPELHTAGQPGSRCRLATLSPAGALPCVSRQMSLFQALHPVVSEGV